MADERHYKTEAGVRVMQGPADAMTPSRYYVDACACGNTWPCADAEKEK